MEGFRRSILERTVAATNDLAWGEVPPTERPSALGEGGGGCSSDSMCFGVGRGRDGQDVKRLTALQTLGFAPEDYTTEAGGGRSICSTSGPAGTALSKCMLGTMVGGATLRIPLIFETALQYMVKTACVRFLRQRRVP